MIFLQNTAYRVDVLLSGEIEDVEQSFDCVLVAIGFRPN